jgi:hypothetical protein
LLVWLPLLPLPWLQKLLQAKLPPAEVAQEVVAPVAAPVETVAVEAARLKLHPNRLCRQNKWWWPRSLRLQWLSCRSTCCCRDC